MSQDDITEFFLQRIKKVQDEGREELDLSNGQLTKIPDAVFELKHLKVLILSGNRIREISDSISLLTNLRELDLSNNQLDSLPNSIAHLLNLVKLNVNNNNISYLPNSITNFKKLRQLYWSKNNLYTIPETIARLTNLIGLDLQDNNLSVLPDYIFNLESLMEIDLSNNQLTNIPESIARLTNLTGLYLNDNQLTNIPESIARLTNLTGLYLSDNQLTYLPSSIANLTKLKELYLSNNQLNREHLPNSISNLHSLAVLGLNNNKFSVFPNCIIPLVNLTTLYLRNNQLTSLPFSITDLKNLEGLYLSGNLITEIPNWLAQSKLKIQIEDESEYGCINLFNNPIETPPIEVVKKGNEFILKYYSQKLKQGKDYLYEAKVLIVGERGTGKTTLAKKIQNTNFLSTQLNESNKGITVNTYYFPLKANNTDHSRSFKLNVWDFSNREIDYLTYSFFLSERSLYILVVDNHTTETSVKYWLNMIKLFTVNSPTLIVLNQKSNIEFPFDTYRVLSRYCESLKEVLTVNCGTNEINNDRQYPKQIRQLIDYIEHHVTNLPHVGESFPVQWIKIRQILESNPDNYISFEKITQICHDHGLTSEQEIFTLLSYFHDLGIILYFADNPILRERIILKFDWAINAVHCIFDSDKIKVKQGRFTRSDCDNLWHNSQYSNASNLLIALMKKFLLIYEIDDTGKLIAPQMLSQNTPPYNWDDTQNFEMQFRYDSFMPQGILWRFITTMYRYVQNHSLVWRNGVILERNGTKAEVVENLVENRIYLRFFGFNIAEFRAIIVDALDKISESYPKLKYDKVVSCICSNCKSSPNPYFFEFSKLEQRQQRKTKDTIECISGNDISLNSLLQGVQLPTIVEKSSDDHQEVRLEPNKRETTITIFLASSSELKAQRDQFEIFIRRRNDYLRQDGIYLKLERWENFVDHMSADGLQNEYNKAVKSCDIFVSLFHTKVGEYTKEEFEKAFQTFQASKKPLIYTYFSQEKAEIKPDIVSVINFQSTLSKLGHYYTKYNNIEDLKFKFDQQLRKVLPELTGIATTNFEQINNNKNQNLTHEKSQNPNDENNSSISVSESTSNKVCEQPKSNVGKAHNLGTVNINDSKINEDTTISEVIEDPIAEVRNILTKLSNTLPTSTKIEKNIVITEAYNQIESNSALKNKVINAIKNQGSQAFKDAINHPLANKLIVFIEE